jgi:hypothetical protein
MNYLYYGVIDVVIVVGAGCVGGIGVGVVSLIIGCFLFLSLQNSLKT